MFNATTLHARVHAFYVPLKLLWYLAFAPLVVLYVALAIASPFATHAAALSVTIYKTGRDYSNWHRNVGRILKEARRAASY